MTDTKARQELLLADARETLLAGMSEMLQDWCQVRGLKAASVDEMLHEDLATLDRRWLSAFLLMWNATEDLPDAAPPVEYRSFAGGEYVAVAGDVMVLDHAGRTWSRKAMPLDGDHSMPVDPGSVPPDVLDRLRAGLAGTMKG